MIPEAIQLEVEDYIEKCRVFRDERGRALVTRNGKARERSVTLGCGSIHVQMPRVRDERDGNPFTSEILPPYMRKSAKVENLLPILYLKGFSTGDFHSALDGLLGEDATAGLSASAIVALKKS
jgi:transposase-like protein